MFKDKFVTPQNTSFDTEFDDSADSVIKRNVGDALKELRDYLTKEEMLCISLYKNSKKQQNHIHIKFLEKYHGKKLTTSAITKRKNRMFKVLEHVGAMVRYKRTNGIDEKLKNILTKKQFDILSVYEKRQIKYFEMREKLGFTDRALTKRYNRAIERLKQSEDPKIKRYLVLLGNTLTFSRKFPALRK